MNISIKKQILNENDRLARENKKIFNLYRIKAFNLMASPGAGKTSLLLSVGKFLLKQYSMAIIEGDIASRLDTDLLLAQGYPAVQINTGGNCHLDAYMIKKVLPKLPLKKIKFLFVENVGNLVCPANFPLGTHKNIVVASVPEGHDKPYKYPGMFMKADAVVLNKIDLLKSSAFNLDYFTHGVKILNPQVPLFLTSCKRDKGIKEVVKWFIKTSVCT